MKSRRELYPPPAPHCGAGAKSRRVLYPPPPATHDGAGAKPRRVLYPARDPSWRRNKVATAVVSTARAPSRRRNKVTTGGAPVARAPSWRRNKDAVVASAGVLVAQRVRYAFYLKKYVGRLKVAHVDFASSGRVQLAHRLQASQTLSISRVGFWQG